MPPKKVGKIHLKNASNKIEAQPRIVEIPSQYAALNINISDLPEEEKLKIGRLVEKLLEIGQKHENTLELLSKERIQHQQELQSLNQHIEEQVTIIENQIKIKDERLISLQNKEQMLTALVALYQKKLKHILELNMVTQHTDQSFQQKMLQKEHECESYQVIIKNHKLVLSTYEENAKQLQRSIQQQLLLEQQKTQEQQIRIQDLSQQVYLLQQDYQNLQYYYKLHSPNHELPKQLYSIAMTTTDTSAALPNPINSTAKPLLTSTSNNHEYTPNFSVESPSFRSQTQPMSSTKRKLDKSLKPAAQLSNDKQIERISAMSTTANGSMQNDFHSSVETASTLGMTSIGQLAANRQPSKTFPPPVNSLMTGKGGDNDLYSDYSLMYHTSFSSQENSFLTNPSQAPHLDDDDGDHLNTSLLSQLSSKDSFDAAKHQSKVRELLNTSAESEHSNIGGLLGHYGATSSSMLHFQPPPLHSSYSKPPTPRVQSSNVIPSISQSTNTSVNSSINLSDGEIVVHSDDFMSPHSKAEVQQQQQHHQQQQQQNRNFVSVSKTTSSEIIKEGSVKEGMSTNTKGIAISSPPLSGAVPGDTFTAPRTLPNPNQKAYSLLNLLSAQPTTSSHADAVRFTQPVKEAVHASHNHETKHAEGVAIANTASQYSKKLSFSTDVNESKLSSTKTESRSRKKSIESHSEKSVEVVVGHEKTNSVRKHKSSVSGGNSSTSTPGTIRKDAMVKLLDDIIETSPQSNHYVKNTISPKQLPTGTGTISSNKANNIITLESDPPNIEMMKRMNGGKLKTVGSNSDLRTRIENISPKEKTDKIKSKQAKTSKEEAVRYEPQLFDLLAEIELKESRYY